MSILTNIENKIKDQVADTTGRVTDELSEQSIAAILGGLGSPAWKKYMENFVDKEGPDRPKQLARLMGEDLAGGDPYIQTAIAYLVSNGSCGSPTRTKLTLQLENGLLDQGL